jgi:hypothetical protein
LKAGNLRKLRDSKPNVATDLMRHAHTGHNLASARRTKRDTRTPAVFHPNTQNFCQFNQNLMSLYSLKINGQK